jgi:ABC-type Mn2+/Zn2+ transport system ATPase subunit
MSALAIEGLEAGYVPGRPVLMGVDLGVSAGSTVAVLGPNGGGKTTLFRALLGELAHLEGAMRLAGRVGYVPQTERARLDFPVSALDVVLMGTYGGVPWYRRLGPSQRRFASEALARVGLEDQAGERFGRLSGGQRQRVLIARALARRAELLLLDEPLSGVDRPSGTRILALFQELKAEGATILVSTHDIEQARSFDLVLCLNGTQIAFGPPAATLTPEVLQRTYGGELIVLEGGERAVVVQHHSHGDDHSHGGNARPTAGRSSG